MDVKERIAHRLKEERLARGWSLDELAARSQVSRAMISKIERGASTPTAVLLARLAEAFGLPMSALMHGAQPRNGSGPGSAVTRLDEQAQWTDPASGYVRRVVSPAAREGDVEIVAIDLPIGARVRFDAARTIHIDGRIVLLAGKLQLSHGGQTWQLQPGDSARIAIHLEHELHNPGGEPARYLVVTRAQRTGPP
jgi:transcriptional regulator with XRE-family HTH domain